MLCTLAELAVTMFAPVMTVTSSITVGIAMGKAGARSGSVVGVTGEGRYRGMRVWLLRVMKVSPEI